MASSFRWIYGKHSVAAVLKNPARDVSRVVLGVPDETIFGLAEQRGVSIEIGDANFFNSLFGKNAAHQKCAAYVADLPELSLDDVTDKEDVRPIVVLDQVTDPQNIGSILRAAAVFGACAVVVQDKHSPELSPVAIKASSGGSEIVPFIRVTNIVNAIKHLQENKFWSVGLDEHAKMSIADLPTETKFAIIIGAEGKGMRKLTKDYCDFLVKIPTGEKFSTLNAAQAATVSLYETFKLRGRK